MGFIVGVGVSRIPTLYTGGEIASYDNNLWRAKVSRMPAACSGPALGMFEVFGWTGPQTW